MPIFIFNLDSLNKTQTERREVPSLAYLSVHAKQSTSILLSCHDLQVPRPWASTHTSLAYHTPLDLPVQ